MTAGTSAKNRTECRIMFVKVLHGNFKIKNILNCIVFAERKHLHNSQLEKKPEKTTKL
jgi:hypothetical protein